MLETIVTVVSAILISILLIGIIVVMVINGKMVDDEWMVRYGQGK